MRGKRCIWIIMYRETETAVSCLQRRQKKRSTCHLEKGKLYIDNYLYKPHSAMTKPGLPKPELQIYNQSVKICVWNINGLNPDKIVDLQSHIEK